MLNLDGAVAPSQCVVMRVMFCFQIASLFIQLFGLSPAFKSNGYMRISAFASSWRCLASSIFYEFSCLSILMDLGRGKTFCAPEDLVDDSNTLALAGH
jgi:hypothetical protein